MYRTKHRNGICRITLFSNVSKRGEQQEEGGGEEVEEEQAAERDDGEQRDEHAPMCYAPEGCAD